eukprot:2902044-Pleurochrysis_carterae.AAC.1
MERGREGEKKGWRRERVRAQTIRGRERKRRKGERTNIWLPWSPCLAGGSRRGCSQRGRRHRERLLRRRPQPRARFQPADGAMRGGFAGCGVKGEAGCVRSSTSESG